MIEPNSPKAKMARRPAGESRADASTLGFQPRDATEPTQTGLPREWGKIVMCVDSETGASIPQTILGV
jgi:hypothetical protein